MKINYTERNENTIKELFSSTDDNLDFDFDSIDDRALLYLKASDSFKHFDEGLIQLFELKKYNVNLNSRNEMADFLISKLDGINSDIENKTVYSWFLGEHRPKIEAGSRRKMYEICFALELALKDTIWFFKHVYCDRAFNYHTIDEAVFYYAFSNGLSYEKSLKIIDTVTKSDTIHTKDSKECSIFKENNSRDKNRTLSNSNLSVSHYTFFVKKELDKMKSTDELTDFLIENKDNFKAWNQSAVKTIREILSEITVPADKKSKIDMLKRRLNKRSQDNNTLDTTNRISSNNSATDKNSLLNTGKIKNQSIIYPSDYDDCGLIIQEIIFDSLINSDPQTEFIKDLLQNRNYTKNASVLRYILTTSKGAGKSDKIPYILRNSFPSKKTMSDILSYEKIAVSKSYDSIRKMIILLEFYRFFASVKLSFNYDDNLQNSYINADFSQYAQSFIDETNYILYDCGYEDLYAGNPYDWIFLCSAHAKKPLEFFKFCFSELLPDEKAQK